MLKANIPEPIVIWDIGSRDGRVAQSFSEFFPRSRIVAFEPNPETYPFVKKIASSNKKIVSKNIAISNLNGFVDFYKIDTLQTITSWVDGNPGASSLLRSNGKYPFEKYIQELIQVRSLRAATLISQKPEIQPQLLWINVQGAEDQVLKSFDTYINQVMIIVVELSLQEIYSEQALAEQVLDGLKEQFYFVKVLNMGSWQFDALLINKLAPYKFKNWIWDKFLRASLKSKRKFGIVRNFPGVSQIVKTRLIALSRIAIDKITLFFRNKNRTYPTSLIKIILSFTNSSSETLASYSRMLAEALLPSNPITTDGNLPNISVLIPVIGKDYTNINLVVEKIVENSANPISAITVVFGGGEPPIVSFSKIEVRILHESEVIPASLEEAIRRYPKNRQGWVRQQVIKFLVSENHETQATLICDSDTFLCEERVWLNELGVQQLQISHEYSSVYEQHFLKTFDEQSGQSTKISFVTHHQLMQKDIIQEMFGQDMSRLFNWLESGDTAEVSPVSEYHSYGRFISRRYPSRYRLSRWNNLFIDGRDQDVKKIIKFHSGKFSSISVHRY